MALRHRKALPIDHTADQENAQPGARAKATIGSRIPKRAALGDIGANKIVTIKAREPIKKIASQSLIKPELQKSKEATKTESAQQKSARNQAALDKYRNPLANLRVKPQPTTVVKSYQACKVFSPVVVPANITDIDDNDHGKIFLAPEYVNDIYKYLRHLELQFPIQEKYLKYGQHITSKMRAVLIDWLVDVQQQYHLLPETLHLCVGIVDLFLQKVRVITKDKLQLVGVTAMFIACKYEETYAPDITDFVYITDSAFSKEQILSLERTMVRKLNFSFGRPSSIHFLRRYSKAAEVTPMHHTFAKYFLDLTLLDYNFVHVRPSLVAAVASFIAYSIYQCESDPSPQKIWNDTLTFYSSYTFSDLKPHIPNMASAILKMSNSKLQAVRNKFSASEMHNISARPELQSDDLKKLAEGI